MNDAAHRTTRRETLGLMAGLMLAVLLALMDQTVVSTALPTVVGQLGGLSLYAWVFSAYMLAQTSFMPILGKLSDLFGRRRLFLLGLALFMGGSALCGQARTMQQLVLFRGLQGIGGAGMMPIALAILGVRYGPRERARLQGILGTAAGLAVVVGPTVGSFIVEHLSWRWVFYVNLPLGVLSALCILVFLRESGERRARAAIGYAGALSLMAGVGALLLGTFFSREHGWISPQVLLPLGAAAVLLPTFLIVEQRAAEPILPLGIFSNRNVAAAASVALIRAIAMYGLVVYVPLLVQGVLGGSAADARNQLIIFAIPGILSAVGAGLLVARGVPYAALVLSGLGLTGAGLWFASQVGPMTPLAQLAPILIAAGIGVGLTQVTLILIFQNNVPRQHMGVASSLSQFLNNLAGTVGVSLLGTYQAARLSEAVAGMLANASQIPSQLRAALSDPGDLARLLMSPGMTRQVPASLLAALRTALAHSLEAVFFVGFILTAIALPAAFLIRGSAPGHAAIRSQEVAERERSGA